MQLRLGIGIACRTAHQASLADDHGEFIWTGRRFHTSPGELEQRWATLPTQTDPGAVTVIVEPTRNAWVPLAAWAGELDYGELADDIAGEARTALQLTQEIGELDKRIKVVLD